MKTGSEEDNEWGKTTECIRDDDIYRTENNGMDMGREEDNEWGKTTERIREDEDEIIYGGLL